MKNHGRIMRRASIRVENCLVWFGAILGLLSMLGAAPALAFKWKTCPAPPLAVYRSKLGATNSPFVHPGHDLTVFLNEAEVTRTGGFAPGPGANLVRVTFVSLFGASIRFPDIAATAASPSALTFSFPDSTASMGRPLAGPVSVEILTLDGRQVAVVAASDLVALPPTNAAEAILQQGAPARAALGADGSLWVPVHFLGDPMPMPGCEGDFIMKSPIDITVAQVDGVSQSEGALLDRATQIDGYAGDMKINGVDFYGWLVPEKIRASKPSATEPHAIRRMNDAADLVFRIQVSSAWAQSRSPLSRIAADSTPLDILLDDTTLSILPPPATNKPTPAAGKGAKTR